MTMPPMKTMPLMDEDAVAALRAAELLGQHALPAFLVGLVAALGFAVLVFAGLRRLATHAAAGGRPPLPLLALRLLLGFGVVLGAGALFAEMLEALDADEEMGLFDSHLAKVLSQTLSPTALHVFSWLTHLGDPITLSAIVVVVALLLLARRHWVLAIGWIAAGAGNGLLNRLLKDIFERVRPEHTHGFTVADGFSFPSGHTSGAVVVYGMLAYLSVHLLAPRWHLPAILAATALAFTMGCSRVLLQVHWASDAVAGFGSGLAWLVVCVLSVELLRHRSRGG